ncbi:MAG: ATP-dependent RecD-like DNA helicase [bacterium]|nr:ATP-dependent RecD-like DNA helicase [bacterium]
MEKSYIKGKFKKIIYQNEDSNFTVALFKVNETNDLEVSKYSDKLIYVTGIIYDIRYDMEYMIYGKLSFHQKYSWQYTIERFKVLEPTTEEEIQNFLASSFVEGCSKQMAKKIVDTYGKESLKKIKEDINNLFVIKGMTTLKATKIYGSILKFEKDDEIIKKLTSWGFTYDETSKILSKHYNDIEPIIEGNLYLLKDIFEFRKIDNIYKNNFYPLSEIRCKECILNTLIDISFAEGSSYYYIEEIYKYLVNNYNISIDNTIFEEYINDLINDNLIIKNDKRYYLKKYYDEENSIARYLYLIDKNEKIRINDFDNKIKEIQKETNKIYSDEQIKAIENALNENITIISGGPGTGKTTIINAIVKLYIKENCLNNEDIINNIALLAPTGRASKKLSNSTSLPAYTIHRLLKWHKESDSFEYNEYNKLYHKLLIVDECSMIDISLMKSLLCAYNSNIKLVLVGDIYQLPSVGPGLVLQDLINSDYFSFNMLNTIYRQSDNSYIPYLAKDIKKQDINEEILTKKDDYNFIVCEKDKILENVIRCVQYGLSKGIDESKMQVLAPMYKGDNGIDNLNLYLEKIYNNNPFMEVKYGDKIYHVNDKVLQLINDSDNNVFNGDIGKIINISKNYDDKIIIQIDFDGNIVSIEKKDLKNITLAYAITIHKSQGSEFEHVIMPICNNYSIMLYNKLIYTAVSRAKKSLTIIGEPSAFIRAVNNNYSMMRKTSLIEYLNKYYNV